MKTADQWAQRIQNSRTWATLVAEIQNDALRHAADVADGLRIPCDTKDTEGLVANLRASAIRDAILRQCVDGEGKA
jgi:hypothetical protein